MTDQWIIARMPTDGGGERWVGANLGDPDDAALHQMVDGFRSHVDMPIDWYTRSGYVLSVSPGEPHPEMLAKLEIVTIKQVQEAGSAEG